MRKALCLLAALACQDAWAGTVVLKGCTVDFLWVGGTGPAQQVCTVELMAGGNLGNTEPDGYVNFTGASPALPAVVRMCGIDEACTTSNNSTARRLKGMVTRTLELSGNPRYEIRFLAQLCADEGCQAAPASGLGPATLFDVDVDTEVRSHGSRVRLGRTASLGACGAGETEVECTTRLLNDAATAAVGTAITAANGASAAAQAVADGVETELRRQLGCAPDEILEACVMRVAQGAAGAAVGAAVETANFILNYCDDGEIDTECLGGLANDTEAAVLGAGVNAVNTGFGLVAPFAAGAEAEARRQLGCAPDEAREACAANAAQDAAGDALGAAVGAVNDGLAAAGLNQ